LRLSCVAGSLFLSDSIPLVLVLNLRCILDRKILPCLVARSLEFRRSLPAVPPEGRHSKSCWKVSSFSEIPFWFSFASCCCHSFCLFHWPDWDGFPSLTIGHFILLYLACLCFLRKTLDSDSAWFDVWRLFFRNTLSLWQQLPAWPQALMTCYRWLARTWASVVGTSNLLLPEPLNEVLVVG